jgi:hypothetical protein
MRLSAQGWMARVSAVSLTVLLLCLSDVLGQTLERPVPAKPTRTEMKAARTTNGVIVKFQEGSGVRLRGGDLVAASGVDLTDFRHALLRAGITPGQVKRLHTRPERELDEERVAARRRSGRDLADLNLYYIIQLPSGANSVDMAEQLNELSVVEFAEPQLEPPPPPVDIAPTTPNFSGSQGYRNPAPDGVGALDPSVVNGGDGTGITLIDVEYEWTLNHEDLELPASANIDTATIINQYGPEHGTAVLGEIGGKRNSYGVTGITPGARLLVAPANTAEYGYSVARAVNLATGVLNAGDTILIEQQMSVCGVGAYGPVEWSTTNFDAIATATALALQLRSLLQV